MSFYFTTLDSELLDAYRAVKHIAGGSFKKNIAFLESSRCMGIVI
jgi:hypothetical protein